MKTVIASLAAVAALTAVAAPAAAQPAYDRGHSGHWQSQGAWTINQRQGQIERMIDRGLRTGAISQREALRLHDDVRAVARVEARYRVNGLSAWERQDLDRRLDRLERTVMAQASDRNDRFARR